RRLSSDVVRSQEPAEAGRQGAGHAGVRKGRQGTALVRRRGLGRASSSRRAGFGQQNGHEEDVARDENVRPMMLKVGCWSLLTTVAVLAASSASAHITLETRQATIGSSYKAVFAVPHGCAGSATVKIRVQIPEGVIAVKPMPKPGWNVETIK